MDKVVELRSEKRSQLREQIWGCNIPSGRNIKCNVPEAGNKPGVSEGWKGGLRGWRVLNVEQSGRKMRSGKKLG